MKKLLLDRKSQDDRKRKFNELLRQKTAALKARDEMAAKWPAPGETMPDGTISCSALEPGKKWGWNDAAFSAANRREFAKIR